MGRRKEREHGGKWFACCPDAMILSLGDFRAFHCGHLKAGSSLELQGSGWHIPKSPQQRAHFGGVHACAHALCSLQALALVLVEEPSYALSWLQVRKALTCVPSAPKQEWQAFSDTALCPCSAESVFLGHLVLGVRGQSHDPWP